MASSNTAFVSKDIPEYVHGLSTHDALQHLREELVECIDNYEAQLKAMRWYEKLGSSFLHHNNVTSVLPWTSVAVVTVCALLLVVAYAAQPQGQQDDWLVVEALLLLLILVVSVYFLAWDDSLRQREMANRARRVLTDIKACYHGDVWSPQEYINLYCPLSPCLSLQWTLRDGQVVNLPTSFLVKGDVILLRPGHVIPATCDEIQTGDMRVHGQYEAGDVYTPTMPCNGDMFYGPQQRLPAKTRLATLQETPFCSSFTMMLERANNRPASLLSNEMHQVCFVWLERRILPTLLVLLLIVNTLRYVFLGKSVGHWTEMIISLQVQALLPLIALVFPILWKVLDAFGVAKIEVIFSHFVATQNGSDETNSLFESKEFSEERHCHLVSYSWTDLWLEFLKVIQGTSDTLPRTANVAHALGNVTSFCCVDKKGILSWPNPTAEKVFFLRNHTDRDEQKDTSCSSMSQEDGATEYMDTAKPTKEKLSPKSEQKFQSEPYTTESTIEVLDLTQDAKNGYGLQFDDPSWKDYLSSLKPLGLNILLNTCNMATVDKYTQFADHLTYTSLGQEESVPVVNRRCFCELAHQIGFADSASDIFKLEQQLGLYRHIPNDGERVYGRGSSKTRSSIKYKMPVPNMFSVIAKDNNTGMLQLFSQGTADLLLDACTDYWDGNDLRVLNDTERKKIADFFQRTSMSSYCTAFAYRPLPQVVVNTFSNVFIEVPSNSQDVFQHLKSPSPHRLGERHQAGDVVPRLKNHYSVDSLVTADVSSSTSDIDTCFRAQCNQIFIGMITMQYQAKQDIVKLIEDLESACIRFVHFSQENELRSRVFSEKMGLEAGWNCHISLLNDKVSPGRSDMSSNTSRTSCHSGNPGPVHHTHRRSIMLHLRVLDEARNQHRRRSAPGIVNLINFPKDTARSPMSISYDTDACVICEDNIDDTFADPLLSAGDRNDDVNVGSDNFLVVGHSAGVSPARSLLSESLNPELKVHGCSGGGDSDTQSEAESIYTTDYSDSVIGGLGLANTANLPKGIENIRPHLENIDNVPLLVSLFTDCTSETTLEMLKILQEWGEVVCCFGSSASSGNTGLFLQGDCSIAVEPLYPPICAKHLVLQRSRDISSLSPMQLSARLNSIPSSLAYERDYPINIIHLIVIARHHCQSMRNTFVFYLTCQLTLTTVQLMGCLLPPCLAPDHLLWLTLVVVPLLSLTMMGNPQDPRMGQLAQGKNLNHISTMCLLRFVGHHLMRSLPCVLICLLCHAITLKALCHKITSVSDVTCCHIFGSVHCSALAHTWNGWKAQFSSGLRLSQNFLATQLVLCFVFTSISFLHRSHHLWQKFPSDNRLWRIITPVILVLQLLYSAVDVAVITGDNRFGLGVTDIPVLSWVLMVLSPVLLVSIHELVKRLEIKSSVRYQKRARLDFGTKLGMNSPF